MGDFRDSHSLAHRCTVFWKDPCGGATGAPITQVTNVAALPSARVPRDAFTQVDGWLPLVRAASPSMIPWLEARRIR